MAHGLGRLAFPFDLHALLKHLGIEEFAMVAHSMGGRTATPFLRLFPGCIRALVLSGTLGSAVNDSVRRIQAAHAERGRGRSMREPVLAPETERTRPDLAHLYRSLNLLNPKRPQLFLEPSPGLTQWHGSSASLLDTSGVPVLFLVGKHDMIVPANAMPAAHAALPDSRYVETLYAGHSVYFEQPPAFNRAVRAFLTESWPAARHAGATQ